jgi:hypothetical protein
MSQMGQQRKSALAIRSPRRCEAVEPAVALCRRQRGVDTGDRRAGAVEDEVALVSLLMSEVFPPPMRSLQSRDDPGVVRGPHS